MLNQFKSFGVSYKEINLADRSRIALNENQLNDLLLYIRDTYQIEEVIIISTCNRTEIFYSHEKDMNKELFSSLFVFRGQLVDNELYSSFLKFESEPALRRLFDISIGLESKVIGDLQIINQVKKAYQKTADLDMCGPFLHRLLHSIFYTNKKIVQETEFRDGAASVSYASFELIEELSSTIVEPKILVLGLGEMGRDISLYLKDHGFKNIILMNRTYETAVKLASELEYEAKEIQELVPVLNEVDIIITSVVVSEPIITKSIIESLDSFALKYILDISMPSSVEPEVGELSGVLLSTIDDIENKTSQAVVKRQKAIPNVKSIIDEAVFDFSKWSQELDVSPTINKLKGALEKIRKEEVSKFISKMDQEQVDIVETVTKSMMQKIIKLPVLELKAACKRGEAETLIDVLSDIFNLEMESKLDS